MKLETKILTAFKWVMEAWPIIIFRNLLSFITIIIRDSVFMVFYNFTIVPAHRRSQIKNWPHSVDANEISSLFSKELIRINFFLTFVRRGSAEC